MHMFSYIRDVLHILPYAECFSMCLNLEGSNVSGKIAGRADVFIFLYQNSLNKKTWWMWKKTGSHFSYKLFKFHGMFDSHRVRNVMNELYLGKSGVRNEQIGAKS